MTRGIRLKDWLRKNVQKKDNECEENEKVKEMRFYRAREKVTAGHRSD